MKPNKLLKRLATTQSNIRFSDLTRLAESLGFELDRTAGSHRIYIHKKHRAAQLNLQPDKGQAKPYQIKQLLRLVEEYNLSIDEQE